ncbi:aminopeptidase [Polaribacter pacificus]|uniref:Aminopeptidase n=1 Tax=Polaribacter pacificus TaxID=1775173 RepID=A0A917MFT4_9FLAO|nr:C1 family peptidase [Polaribacter pacificus]GGH03972.1 aminopeptidase [Polaribacter pacificus]
MKYIIVLLCIAFGLETQAQNTNDFEIQIKLQTTKLNDQQSSGTCWSFATTSFIETEALRLGNDTVTLSPIFYVKPTYIKKAEKFIDKKGESWFKAGDLTFSVLDAYKKYGAVPEQAYNGIIEGDWQHDHVEMDNLLSAMVESVGNSGYGRIKPQSWKKSVNGVLNAYLGIAPKTFNYKGKSYTPQTFADTFIGINPDDYIEITSYSHLEFYKNVVLNIPANWNDNKYLNLPIKDFESVINNALKNGYSLAWDGDATEPNFDFQKGVLNLIEQQEDSKITQIIRQLTFEDGTTTDDHNMHIIGTAKDKNGKLYYLLKNSEGSNSMDGYIYMSKNSLLLKTISVLVHKDAIPAVIKKKLI